MDYANMTQDELLKTLAERDETIITLSASIEANGKTLTDAEAERDSYKTELEALKAAHETMAAELKQTKELNFTLGRQVNTQAQKVEAESALHALFGRKDRE